MELSWIQRHIVSVLLRNKAARVKELCPPDVPANQFSYHLEAMTQKGLVEKVARGTYRLTPLGERFIGSVSAATNKPVENIKTVIMLYAKQGDTYLLFRWSRQPYIGYVTLPHDRMQFGEPLEGAIKKAMDEKLGQQFPAAYKTSMLIKVVRRGTLISHMNARIYGVGIDNLTTFRFTAVNGEAYGVTLKQAVERMSGIDDLIRAIEGEYDGAELTLSYE